MVPYPDAVRAMHLQLGRMLRRGDTASVERRGWEEGEKIVISRRGRVLKILNM